MQARSWGRSVKLCRVMYSAWAVKQIAYVQEEMDCRSQLKPNIPNKLVRWIRFLSPQCLSWSGFFPLQVNETGHKVSDQNIHLWNRAIHLVAQKHHNIEYRQSGTVKNDILKLAEKFDYRNKSLLLLFNFQCLTLLIKTTSNSSCPGECLNACLPLLAFHSLHWIVLLKNWLAQTLL